MANHHYHLQQRQQQQMYPSSLANMPEPPPAYSEATAAPSMPGRERPGNSYPCNNNDSLTSETDQKFMTQPSNHQQYMLPPGAVPQPPLGPPPAPPAHFHPGFINSAGMNGGQQQQSAPNVPTGAVPPAPMPAATGIGSPPIQPATGQVKVIYAVPLGPREVQLECANCRQPVRTRVVRRAGLLAWLICGALALVGCWPCCVLPFCVQSCQDAEHYCPNCNCFIGKYSRV